MKKTFAFGICFVMLCFVSCSDNKAPQTPKPTIESLYAVMEKDVAYSAQFFKGVRDEGIMYSVFFKYNDNIPRALVSSWTQRGSQEYDWIHYYFKNGQWEQDVSGCVGAHPMDFHTLTEEGQGPKLILIQNDKYSVPNKELESADEYMSRIVYQIAIDNEGYLKKIPIPDFEIKDVFIGTHGYPETYCFEGFPEIKLKSPKDKLEPVKVETFYPKDFEPKK